MVPMVGFTTIPGLGFGNNSWNCKLIHKWPWSSIHQILLISGKKPVPNDSHRTELHHHLVFALSWTIVCLSGFIIGTQGIHCFHPPCIYLYNLVEKIFGIKTGFRFFTLFHLGYMRIQHQVAAMATQFRNRYITIVRNRPYPLKLFWDAKPHLYDKVFRKIFASTGEFINSPIHSFHDERSFTRRIFSNIRL